MTTDIQTEVSGLIPEIRKTQIELSKLNSELLEAEENLRNTEEQKKVNGLKLAIQLKEESEKILRNNGKELMIQNGLHDFTTLDGVTVQLNKTPGSLVIEKGAESKIPEEYWKVKKEIDKTAVKNAIKEGKFYDDDIYIDVEYKLVIKD